MNAVLKALQTALLLRSHCSGFGGSVPCSVVVFSDAWRSYDPHSVVVNVGHTILTANALLDKQNVEKEEQDTGERRPLWQSRLWEQLEEQKRDSRKR